MPPPPVLLVKRNLVSVFRVTCGESLLDQRHAVATAHQLHVHARQRGPGAHKLNSQAGWRAARDLQALPAGTQSPRAWNHTSTHGSDKEQERPDPLKSVTHKVRLPH